MKTYTLHEICEALELIADKSVAEKYRANALAPSGLRYARTYKSAKGTVFQAFDLSRAYSKGFNFANSPEGWDFWSDVWDELDSWYESEIWDAIDNSQISSETPDLE